MADNNSENSSVLEPQKTDASSRIKMSIPSFGGDQRWEETKVNELDNKQSQENVPPVDNKDSKVEVPKDKNSFRKGIEKLKKQRDEKQQENESIIKKYAELEKKNAELEKLIKQPVNRENFSSDADMIRYVQRTELDHSETNRERVQLANKYNENVQHVGNYSWEEKIHNSFDTPEDVERFKSKMAANSALVLQPHVANYIKQADIGPKMAEYMADHKDELEELNSLHPDVAIVELGLIRRELKGSKSVRKESSAPNPIGTPGSTKVDGKDINQLPFQEQLRLHRKKQAELRARK